MTEQPGAKSSGSEAPVIALPPPSASNDTKTPPDETTALNSDSTEKKSYVEGDFCNFEK